MSATKNLFMQLREEQMQKDKDIDLDMQYLEWLNQQSKTINNEYHTKSKEPLDK